MHRVRTLLRSMSDGAIRSRSYGQILRCCRSRRARHPARSTRIARRLQARGLALSDRLGIAIRKALFAFNSVVMLVFFAVVFWTGLDYVRFTWDFELDYSSIPKYWFYSCMPVWGGLMLIVLLKKLICMEIPDITEPDTDL